MKGPQGRSPKPKRNRRHCAYCDARRTTFDHVPPAGIFGEPLEGLPSGKSPNLITVPACGRCNWSATLDDTYFRDCLAWMAARKDSHSAPDVLRATVRSVHSALKDGRSAPAARLFTDARLTYGVLDASGIVQSAYAIPIRWDRIKRVAERTIRGLHWHETGSRVAEGFEVTIIGDRERDSGTIEQSRAFSDLADEALKGRRRIIHPTKFMYSAAFAREDPRYSIWLLVFFREVIFMGLVTPIDPPRTIVIPRLPPLVNR